MPSVQSSKNHRIITSIDDFLSITPAKIGKSHQKILNALTEYLKNNRFIRVIEKENDFPELVYPTKSRLNFLIKENKALLENYSRKKLAWQRKLFEAKSYHLIHSIKKFSSPLYWKHLRKQLTDAGYKADAEKIKLPAHLVSDPKWVPMVKTFLENPDYRKQLVETVENSIVYKENKRVAKYADFIKDFREKESEKKLKELQEKIDELNKFINALTELLAWAPK